VSLEFLKHCSLPEIKVLFYSIWNVSFEAKQAGLFKECQLMLRQLYETVKKFSAFFNESIAFKFSKQQNKRQDEAMMQEILFKTLSLICDLNLLLKNFQAAKLAVKDLEVLQRNDCNTYLMKVRVLLAQSSDDKTCLPEVLEALS
jgi:hypothetical protein